MFDCFLTTAFFSICVVCVLLAAHVKSWFIGPGLGGGFMVSTSFWAL